MSFSVNKLTYINPIYVPLTSRNLDSLLIYPLEYLVRRYEHCFSMLCIITFHLSEVKCVFVSQNSEIFAFYHVPYLKVFHDRSVTLQIVNIFILFRDSEQSFIFIYEFRFVFLSFIFFFPFNVRLTSG